MNRARAEQNRPALDLFDPLSSAAQMRAEELAAAGSLDSAGAPGEDLLRRAQRTGYPVGAIAEAVVQSEGSPSDVVDFLKKRADHLWEELSSERYRDLGVGVAAMDGGPVYVLFVGATSGETFARRTQAIRDRDRVRRELLIAINRYREANRRPPLRIHPLLEQVAQRHADDMLARGYYGHASPEGAMVLERTRKAGYAANSVGENIAKGQTSVQEVVDGWISSPRHRKNILDLLFQETGFGIAIGKMPEGDQVLWVHVFGQPRERP
ncbi:MAG: CAP domain-containing protein [Acidobacteriota bacterium]